MIKYKNADKVKQLISEKAGMFSASEFNKIYSELKILYGLLEKAVNRIEYLENNKQDSFIQDTKNKLQNLL